ADLQAETAEYPEGSAIARRHGHRTVLNVPLLREGVALGTISLRREEVRPFGDRHVVLLQTFADQAVIAIENVRLFQELDSRNRALTESLEQQTATGEILRVISGSPTDVQPVFDVIARSAVQLCRATVSTVTRFDGEWVHLGAVHGTNPSGLDALRSAFPMRPSGGSGAIRAIRVRADREYRIQGAAVAAGFRSLLAVPMLRDGRAIGAITVGRADTGDFGEEQ